MPVMVCVMVCECKCVGVYQEKGKDRLCVYVCVCMCVYVCVCMCVYSYEVSLYVTEG